MANKTAGFQKQEPLSDDKVAYLRTFNIYILFLNSEVLILVWSGSDVSFHQQSKKQKNNVLIKNRQYITL